jgi:hypothetical protein
MRHDGDFYRAWIMAAAAFAFCACSLKTQGELPDDAATQDGPACPEGRIRCGDFCVDPVSDRFNCGGCGIECGDLETCMDARCRCLEGYERCDGACVNVRIDRRHCGECNHACDPLSTCVDGACVCPGGLTDCGGECVDTNTDSQNCGGCGIACTGGEFCNGRGSCSVECDPPYTLCSPGGDAYCADLDRDPYNCGGCGNVCGPYDHAVPECEGGACGFTCDFGYGDANGLLDDGCECTVTSTDETCDGEDNNCNGLADEGFECPRGTMLDCTLTASCLGTQLCTDECRWTDCTSLDWECTSPGASESRDCGAGGCGTQSRACRDDCTWADWEACGLRPGARCFPGDSSACTASCGSSGTRSCTDACDWGACAPPPETCNGVDDDCDGACDNGFTCCSGASGSCTTSCGTAGSRTCGASCAWGSCAPPPETCNGADDDCDGACDNGFECCRGATSTCTTSCNTAGTRTCRSACTWGSCAPPPETCNGVDDDCDGVCDEGFDCCAGVDMRCAVDPSTGADAVQACGDTCRWGVAQPCSDHPYETCCMVGDAARCCVQCFPPNNCI